MTIARQDITGLILAGGQGSRMGGLDKGLQLLKGEPLALHAMRRLAPQVTRLLISANRNLKDYRSLGAGLADSLGIDVEIITDQFPGHAGPLAGLQAGLSHCATPWLLTAPCDVPFLPTDLAAQLAAAAEASAASLAYAVTGDADALRAHPVVSLVRTDRLEGLTHSLHAGIRKVREWQAGVPSVAVRFADEHAFRNLNTLADLARLADQGDAGEPYC